MAVSYLTAKARPVAHDRAGHHVVAVERITPGELVAAFGGRCVERVEFDLLPVARQVRSLQIDEGLYLAASADPEPAEFILHNCDANCGLRGANMLVATRSIAAGEAVTFDRACSAGSDYADTECACGAAACRGKVTGLDWMLPELQLRYRGYFSPYLAVRIAGLVSTGAGRRAFAL